MPLPARLLMSIFARRLPPRGTLALEYVNVKVKVHKEVIDTHRLGNFLANLARPRMSDNERLALLAMFIPFHLYTAQQAGEVLAQFGFGEEKVQAALLVTFRYEMSAGNEGVAVQRQHHWHRAQPGQTCILVEGSPADLSDVPCVVVLKLQHRNITTLLVRLASSEQSGCWLLQADRS